MNNFYRCQLQLSLVDVLLPAIILLGLVLACYAATSDFALRGQFDLGEFQALSATLSCCLECLSFHHFNPGNIPCKLYLQPRT